MIVASIAILFAMLRERVKAYVNSDAERVFLEMAHHPQLAKRRIAKRRCELSLIEFVEVFWGIVDPEQPFVRTWVQEAICKHLEAVTAGKMTKLLINVPPGFTKSMLVNVFWPAWEWGPRNRPDLRYISWSYSPQLTERDNENCRKIIESPLYQEWWGDRFAMDPTTNAKRFYKNSKGGFRIATSIDGAGTGFRADRLIWDDPHNANDSDNPNEIKRTVKWFARTLPTRVRNASGGISTIKVPRWVREVHGLADDNPFTDEHGNVIDPSLMADVGKRKAMISATVGIMQRIHLKDVSGVILENPSLGYEHLMIEMEYKGKAHPVRQLATRKPSTIDYEDPREAVEAVIATLQDFKIAPDDAWGAFCYQWRQIGVYHARLADPVRWDAHAVYTTKEQMKLASGNDAVAAQFDQWPTQASGDWFPNVKSKIIPAIAVPDLIGEATRGFDFASGSGLDAAQTGSVRIQTGVDKRIYISHSSAIRGGPHLVDIYMKKTHADDPMGVRWSMPEDPGSGGKHVVAYHKRENAPGRWVHDSREEKSKTTRARPIAAQFSSGNVLIVEHEGMDELIHELEDFPFGGFVDLVDALSRAYDAHLNMPQASESSGGELIDTSGGGELFQ